MAKSDEGAGGEWSGGHVPVEQEPRRHELMRHVIGVKQLVTFRAPPDGGPIDRLCAEASQFLASQTDGVYQADGHGFFAANGTLLLGE